MRLFVAIELTEEQKNELQRIQSDLRKICGDSLRFIPYENLHLTLKFIGDLNLDLLDDAKDLLCEVVKSAHPFNLGLHGAGVFPARGAVRVCWIGMRSSDAVLVQLSAVLNDAFELLDVPTEKRAFQAHITIARPGKGQLDSDRLREIFEKIEVAHIEQEISSIALFSSELSSSGSKYRIVERFPFKKQV